MTGEGDKGVHYSGGWFDDSREEIEKARKVAHGDFLWFERDGKSYVIDDPSTLAHRSSPCRIKWTLWASSRRSWASSRKRWASNRKSSAGRWNRSGFPLPTCRRKLAKLQAVQAKLAAIQGKDASQQELGEIQSELG